MGSGYYGEPNLGNERGSGSSRKGKKNNSDKPKQPQRGLGVAQLEKIRLHGQMGGYHPSFQAPYPPNFNQEDIRMQAPYSSIPAAASSFSYSSSSSSAASSAASYGFHPAANMMMGLGDYERTNIRYGDSSQPSSTPSWHPGSSIFESQHVAQPSTTISPFNVHLEESQPNRSKKHRSDSMGSSSQNSESSDTPELDLELRLSL